MAKGDIVITARFVDKLTKGLRTTRQSINQMGQTTKTVTKQFKQLNDGSRKLVKQTTQVRKVVQSVGVAQGGFSKTMGMSLVQWRQFNALGGKFKTIGGRVANRFRLMSHGMRGFRMEMLGVMFFGMGLQKFFTGLLKPALKLTGMFEIWTAVLQIVFLPMALLLLNVLMPLFEWMMNWSESTKRMVGWLVLIGAVIGATLFLFGMFALGIGSVILAFAGLFIIIDKLIPDITILGVNYSSFLEMGLGITVVTAAWGFFKDIVNKVLGILFGLGPIKQLMEKLNIEYDNSISAWANMKVIIKSVFDKLKEKLGIASGDGEGGVGFFGEIIQSVNDLWDDMQEKIDELKIDDLAASMNKMADAVKEMLPSMETFAKMVERIAVAYARIGIIGKNVVQDVKDISKGKLPRARGGFGLGLGIREGGGSSGVTGTFQTGGFVPRTGLFKLHAGERVIPAGDTFTSSPTIIVNASPGMNVAELAREVSEIVTRDLASISRR